MRRIFLRLAGTVAVLLIGGVVSLSLWLPMVISGIGPRCGLTVEAYNRVGYGRLELSRTEFRMPGIEVRADRISLPVWPLWLLRSDQRQHDVSDTPHIVVDDSQPFRGCDR